MISILKKLFGTSNDRIIKKLRKEITKINDLEPHIQKLSDSELKNKTQEFRELLKNGKTLDEILYEAFAVVREASKRVLNQRHYDEQLIGGIILHRGMISEMRTGEGKTLVVTLPAYLNALSGCGVHVVTVNDYLVQRDSSWMSRIFEFLGLSVGCVYSSIKDEKRKEAYNCDITYATNNELGFDYLRDNMKYSIEEKSVKKLNYAIIDEVDSVLIDEARTPLIISGPVDHNLELYSYIDLIVNTLTADEYEKDEKIKTINLNEAGTNKIEDLLIHHEVIRAGSTLYDVENMKLVHYINQSLKAHFLFSKDVDYIVKEGRVMIIDEFTGRIMDGRRYSDGLHQAIEAKENVKVQNENQTLASITFQNYFRMYEKISGMTGTAMTEAAELKDIYNLEVISVPTHNKVKRVDHHDVIYGTKEEKHNAVVELVKERHERGQPILIGTISIEKSEEISNLLAKNGLKHNILNAKYHEKEAYIIAQAGRFGAITIATNMAGRGTDITLGGNAEMLAEEIQIDINEDAEKYQQIKVMVENEKEKVLEAGGLFVLATERHESRRIDNQLRGRCGRQGDVGETKFFLSLDDDLMRIFASDKTASFLKNIGLKNGEAIFHPMINRAIEKAQQKVEAHNYEIRKNLLKFDDVMNDQRKITYEQRTQIILAEDLTNTFYYFVEEFVSSSVSKFIPKDSFRESWQLDDLRHEIKRVLNIEIDTQKILTSELSEESIISDIINKVKIIYIAKQRKYSKEIILDASRYIFINILDQLWKDHLHTLDQLRHGIQLRAYGQKDPLNEYKREAFSFFDIMLSRVTELFVQGIIMFEVDKERMGEDTFALSKLKLSDSVETREDPALAKYNSSTLVETKLRPTKVYVEPENRNPNDESTWGRISRNETCPCGSSKKYKHCHGM
jgi:preprotein translocase subunit SecA